ncbi:MAG: hypothetical protein EXR70_15520 [Deltaproteobacteria bacterium]|nr:hypothetical protein [Deltaproteobacteria bacterium]
MIPTVMLRRFIIGYSAMLALMVAVSSYAVLRLGNLGDAAHVALNIEQRLLDHAEGLADAFLSEVRYAGKFTVTQAAVHYDQYKQFTADFDRHMEQLKKLGPSADAARRLSPAEEYHAQYRRLFEKEVDYIKTKQPYAKTRYREDKERLVDYLLREHDAFKNDLQHSLQQRIGYIETAALTSQKLTIAATLLMVVMGVFFACWFSGKLPNRWRGSVGLRTAALISRWRVSSWRKGLGAPK